MNVLQLKVFIFTKLNEVLQKYPMKILNTKESINYIRETGASLSRFGEGEIELMDKKMDLKFQRYDGKLALRMKEVILSDNKAIAVGIPLALKNRDHLNTRAKAFWDSHTSYDMVNWVKYIKLRKTYLDSLMTRCYIDLVDKSESTEIYEMWKEIWKNKRLLIIEGEKSRLGIGNDLFEEALEIRRIICPSENAFDQYDSILCEALKQPKEMLILIALGPTASVLAYDLAVNGFQALDIGHIDIEYEWYKMGTEVPVKIANKYTNEVRDGNLVQDISGREYEKEIIAKFI